MARPHSSQSPRQRGKSVDPAAKRGRAPRHLAQCTRGLEQVLADELSALGATGTTIVPGGVLFAADHALACRATFWLRSAVRVLEPVIAGRIGDFDQLYELASRPRWEELIGPQHTFAIQASVTNGPFTDRHFAALRLKDAVVDRIRSRRNRRPDVERHDPDVPLRLVVRGEEAYIFRDLAGVSLHRRGYRPAQVKSPLSEAVAAGLLLLTDWDRQSPLLDPFCGSGTFIIEAAALAADRAPGFSRTFAAERFPDAEPAIWKRLREEAHDRLKPRLGCALLGTDHHPGAVSIAKESAKAAGLAELVEFAVAEAADFEPPFSPRVVVTNPPWGERMGEGDELIATWRILGTFLRRCPGAHAYILSGAPELTRHIGMRSSQRWPVKISQLDARWLRYEIHQRRPPKESAAPEETSEA